MHSAGGSEEVQVQQIEVSQEHKDKLVRIVSDASAAIKQTPSKEITEKRLTLLETRFLKELQESPPEKREQLLRSWETKLKAKLS